MIGGLIGSYQQREQAKKLAKQTQAEKDALKLAESLRTSYDTTYAGKGGINERFINEVNKLQGGDFREQLSAQGRSNNMRGLGVGFDPNTGRMASATSNQARSALTRDASMQAGSHGAAASAYQTAALGAADLGQGLLGQATQGYTTSAGIGAQNAISKYGLAADKWGVLADALTQGEKIGAYKGGERYNSWNEQQYAGNGGLLNWGRSGFSGAAVPMAG
jgi:hypothetical protein